MQLRLEHLNKTYTTKRASVTAVKDVSLDFPDNSIIGIIGKSGAGKSSLLRLASLLETPDRGEVYYDGVRVDHLPKKELNRRRLEIGMIFQNFNLFSSRTAGKNVAFPLELAGWNRRDIDARVKEMLALVGLEDREKSPITTLSGGQKQRVAIARALAPRPNILFCDEATSALDPQTTKAILRLIADINKKLGLTVVVITHEMQVIKDICDKVAVIDKGVIAEQGTVFDIFTEPQQPITKEFISVLLSNDLPAAFRGSAVTQEKTPGSLLLLRLTFLGESADDPVLAGMIRKFPDVETTMLFGTLDQIKEMPFGRMIVGLTGPDESVTAALAYLKEKDLKEEVIGYAKRHD